MADIPDDAIEAARQAFDDMYAEGQFWTSEEVAARVLAAAAPALRRHIADEIEAIQTDHNYAIQLAARVVRGDDNA